MSNVRVGQGALPSFLGLPAFWRGLSGSRDAVPYLALLSHWQEAGKKLSFLSSFKIMMMCMCGPAHNNACVLKPKNNFMWVVGSNSDP